MCSLFIPAGLVVNDGGLSWLRKSYQRMKQQAEREQRNLSDVVAERYGVRFNAPCGPHILTHIHVQKFSGHPTDDTHCITTEIWT